MPAIAFDTLRFSKHLARAGATPELAEATAEAFKEASQEADLATRQDIERFEEKVDARIEHLEVSLNAKIDAMEQRLIIKLGGMMVVAAVAIAALVKIL